MAIRSVFFPSESRFFPGQRWVNIGLRTFHLIGVAGLGGGFLYASATDAWVGYLHMTLLSGIGLTVISVYSNGVFLLQLRGQAVGLKILLLLLIPVWPEATVALFLMVIVLSGVIAHAPASVRYFSMFHWRRIERL